MTRIRRKGDRTLARYYLTKAARIRIKIADDEAYLVVKIWFLKV
jgi:hypothetical protein